MTIRICITNIRHWNQSQRCLKNAACRIGEYDVLCRPKQRAV